MTLSDRRSPAWACALPLLTEAARTPTTRPMSSTAEGRQQSRHLDKVHHPPEVVRQDRHTALRPHLCQAAPEQRARVPPSLPRPTRVLHPLLALLPHLRPTADAWLHGCQQVVIHPPSRRRPPWVRV